jgi:hypothetical protein
MIFVFKTTTKYSEVIEVHTGKRLRDVEYFASFNKEGVPIKFKGSYYICDGGFHEWRCLQVRLNLFCLCFSLPKLMSMQSSGQFETVLLIESLFHNLNEIQL